MSYYNIKNTNGKIKDIDISNATVTGYFSKFGNIDSDNDMIIKGAFKKTIIERGPQGKNQIWFLQDHDWTKLLSKPNVLKEDNFGLYYEAKVNDKISYAKDALILMSDGHYTEHSFAFQTIKDEKKENYRELQELKMYEGSIVALGANSETPFMGFKNCKTNESKSHFLIKEVEKIQSALKTNGLTDETYRIFEMQLLQLKQMMFDFEPLNSTPQEPETLKIDNNKNYLLKLLTNGI